MCICIFQIGELYLENCRYDCDIEISEMGRFDMLDIDLPDTTTEDIMNLDDDIDDGSGDIELPSEAEEEDVSP